LSCASPVAAVFSLIFFLPRALVSKAARRLMNDRTVPALMTGLSGGNFASQGDFLPLECLGTR
jgi:hypothetical protein